jgi:hypothetical protein
MRKQLRTENIKDVFVEQTKGTRFYENYGISQWVYVPENFQELRELLLNKLQELKVMLFDTGIRKGYDEEIWVRGICFKKDNTVSVRVKENDIRVIMVGVDYSLMWEMIQTILNHI